MSKKKTVSKSKLDPRIKEAIVDLCLSVVKGLKITIVYIIPAVLIAILSSYELRSVIEESPQLAIYAPVINFAMIVIADTIKKHLPEDSDISKVL